MITQAAEPMAQDSLCYVTCSDYETLRYETSLSDYETRAVLATNTIIIVKRQQG